MAKRDKTRKRISNAERKSLFRRDRYFCGYCLEKRSRKYSTLVVDHIIPVSEGGHHGESNWVTSCRSCNAKKWFYKPREKTAPVLLRFANKTVAKVTLMAKGKKFSRRIPNISFKKH